MKQAGMTRLFLSPDLGSSPGSGADRPEPQSPSVSAIPSHFPGSLGFGDLSGRSLVRRLIPSHFPCSRTEKGIALSGMIVLFLCGILLSTGSLLAAFPNAIQRDVQRVLSFSRELRDMEDEMGRLQKAVGLRDRGHFTPDEENDIERLLFRYLLCRDSLWEIVDRYREEGRSDLRTLDGARGFSIGLNAAAKLAYYSSKLVVTFMDEEAVVAKLNQPLHVYGIPAGTFDTLFNGVTDPENLHDLHVAGELFRRESGSPETPLYTLSAHSSAYRELIRESHAFLGSADSQVTVILNKSSILLPDLRNRLRHTDVNAILQKTQKLVIDNIYSLQGTFFNNIGRIRVPKATKIVLEPDQIAEVKALLRPGDLLFTFSSGYMSNIFLPGQFKHGITYVGSPEERLETGLTPDRFSELPEPKRAQLLASLRQRSLPEGYPANCIEAVAEGVIFNSVEHLLQGKIYRLAVLRPRLDSEDRTEALATVFGLLGAEYDFDFDFTDATYLCCTEVIYRSLHARNGIRFELVPRMGKATLSADDILHYHLDASPRVFDVVLLMAPADDEDTRAKILTGWRARRRLRRLME